MADWTPFIVAIMAFCAIAGTAFVGGQYYLRTVSLNRRLPLPEIVEDSVVAAPGLARFVARHFDEKRFGVDETLRGKLRLNLVRAGYFSRNAINFYIFWRLAAVVTLPIFVYLILGIAVSGVSFAKTAIVIAIAMGLGIMGPDAFITRKQRVLSVQYRHVFPDFLDLLLVCVDAGLSLEAALDRITGGISKRSRLFGINLAVMAAEMRAGRSFVEALGTFADRLMIPEARSLVGVLRQSTELGSDVGEALRVFGDEMRNRRMLLAEEQAGKLPVKMLLPMGMFIFPVVIMVTVLPMVIRLLAVFGK